MKYVIWDLDGTLLNSYDVILDALEESFEKYNILYNRNESRKKIIGTSTSKFIQEKAILYGLRFDELKADFSNILKLKNSEIQLMDGARQTLKYLNVNNVKQFVYTHKSDNSIEILKNFDVFFYFIEVITSSYNFQKKPNAEAIIYLTDKYKLDLKETYYIGDRFIDIELAKNSNIKSVNFLSHSYANNIQISKLEDIINKKIIL